jgi:hypothetical protein
VELGYWGALLVFCMVIEEGELMMQWFCNILLNGMVWVGIGKGNVIDSLGII